MLTPEVFLKNLKTAALAKGERYDNKILQQWNNAQTTCAICGRENVKCDNSHTMKKKRSGVLGSQVYALPLCRDCHTEYETVSIETYLQNHPNLFEIVTRHIEKQFDYFTGSEKPVTKKAKVKQAPAKDKIFKPLKDRTDGMEKCRGCFLTSVPSDPVRHKESCKYNQ